MRAVMLLDCVSALPAARGFTFWPGSSLWTPAVATISPSLTPEAISAVSSRQRAMVTGRSATVPLALSTTQTAGCVPCWKIADSGTSATSSASGRSKVSVAVMPMPMNGGGSTMVKRAG